MRAAAVLAAALLLSGCDPVTPTSPAPVTTPAEDDPGFDCRVHGNGSCVSISP